MPHSVPPPQQPVIVQTLTSQRSNSSLNNPATPTAAKLRDKLVSISKAAPPQITNQAALLGAPVSVGYQVEIKPSRVTPPEIQPLAVDHVGTSEAIAKLKKAANNNNIAPSGKIQPLAVNHVGTSQAIAKLKKLATQQNISQTQPASTREQLAPQSPSRSPNPQPREFNFQAPAVETQPSEQQQPQTELILAPPRERILELRSDRQEFDEQRQVVTAEGNVLLRFEDGVVDADRLQVNLDNLIAVGEGNVAFTRGQQVLRGERFNYNFVQNSGDLAGGRGEIFIPTAGTDFSFGLPTDVSAGVVAPRPASDRLIVSQPLQQVVNTGGLGIVVGSTRNVSGIPLSQAGGAVRQIRFEAENINFYPEGWEANNVRLTNDPFSPPELEVRADKVTLTRETPYRDRIRTTRQRLVLDQGLSLPIPRNQAVIDRRERDASPALANVAYDGGDRGGLYLERTFTPIDTQSVQLSITPQLFAQKAVEENGGNIFDPALYGLRAKLDATLGPQTSLRGSAVFNTLDFNQVGDEARASLRLRQRIGTTLPHTLTLESSYRDRLFNGSLGFQTVRSSFGGILTSPAIPLGKTGIYLSYQAGAQYITADTDRVDLLEPLDPLNPIRDNNRVSLSRFQGSAALNRGFLLWQGRALPPTAQAGLRYTPAPVIPFVQLFTGVTGTSSFYSSGDNQSSLTGTIGIQGQFGHFSRSFFDYTSFNISYSQVTINGISPFLFDRVADTKVVAAGLTQQIYGPFRVGFQTLLNIDTGQEISTDYILEYSRRTYGITLRYNPVLELGSINFRLSDFNWFGGSNLFSGEEVKPVVGGVRRGND